MEFSNGVLVQGFLAVHAGRREVSQANSLDPRRTVKRIDKTENVGDGASSSDVALIKCHSQSVRMPFGQELPLFCTSHLSTVRPESFYYVFTSIFIRGLCDSSIV